MSNPDSFEVHLQSLADFAWELEGQLEALRLTRDRLSALSGKAEPLGGFPEAFSLGDRHRRAAQDMATLLESVQQVMGFAAGVTRGVAASYAEYDERAAASFRQGVSGAAFGLSPSIVAPPPSLSPPPVGAPSLNNAVPVVGSAAVPPPPPPPRPAGGTGGTGGTVYYSSQYRPMPNADQPDAN